MAKIDLQHSLQICAGDSLFLSSEAYHIDKIPFKRSRLGGARLFCQALFDSFWGAKKNEERTKTIFTYVYVKN